MYQNWTKIPGSEIYYCNKLGQVASKYKRGARKKTTDSLNVLKQSQSKSGYKIVHLYENNKRKTAQVHQIICQTFIGPSNGLWVNHINANKSDNRLENLEYVTPKQNYEHANNLKLMKRPPVKRNFNKEQVFEILGSNFGCIILGKKFKVNPASIVSIRSGRSYKDWFNEYRKINSVV